MERWTKAWQEPLAAHESLDEKALTEWMRSRPASVQAAMGVFPPQCLVRARNGLGLVVPAPGTTGVVTGYFTKPDGGVLLGVTQSPDSSMVGQVEIDWVEPVGYWHGLTPERVKQILMMQ